MNTRSYRAGWCVLVLGCILACTSRGSAATYSLRDLGPLHDLEGRDEAQPTAIGPDGQVVGSNALPGYYRAQLYEDSWRDLGTLGGGESFGADVNVHGQVVGYAHSDADDVLAFVWTPGATDGVPGNPEMRSLGTLDGERSEAYGINDEGEITGYSDAGNRAHAFIYRDGVMTDIGEDIGNLPNSFGFAINESGHVAGAAYNAGYSNSQAFFFDGQTGHLLGDLSGGESFALDLNDADHVVGYSSLTDGREHGFLYRSGTMDDLGTLGGGYSYALAINNSDEVVGGSFTDPQNATYHAFLWRAGTMVDLNDLLDTSGAGWELIEARSINDRGQIVGEGQFNGGPRGFLLTLNTPVTGLVIAGVAIDGSDVLVTVATVLGETYALEATQGGFQDWTTVVPNVSGTGGDLIITDSDGAGQDERFYRVRRTSP